MLALIFLSISVWGRWVAALDITMAHNSIVLMNHLHSLWNYLHFPCEIVIFMTFCDVYLFPASSIGFSGFLHKRRAFAMKFLSSPRVANSIDMRVPGKYHSLNIRLVANGKTLAICLGGSSLKDWPALYGASRHHYAEPATSNLYLVLSVLPTVYWLKGSIFSVYSPYQSILELPLYCRQWSLL